MEMHQAHVREDFGLAKTPVLANTSDSDAAVRAGSATVGGWDAAEEEVLLSGGVLHRVLEALADPQAVHSSPDLRYLQQTQVTYHTTCIMLTCGHDPPGFLE